MLLKVQTCPYAQQFIDIEAAFADLIEEYVLFGVNASNYNLEKKRSKGAEEVSKDKTFQRSSDQIQL